MDEVVNLGQLQSVIAEAVKTAVQESGPHRAEVDPNLSAQVQMLRAKLEQATGQISELNTAKQAAEEMAQKNQLEAAISIALSPFQFVNESSRQVAHDYFRGKATRTDGGSLVIDQQPLHRFVEKEMGSLSGLLAPTRNGGANASAGSHRQNAGFELEQIRPGMSPEARAAAIAAIRSVNGH